MTATLAELEARVAALEADRADYKAVLAAVNVLGLQTRERFDVSDRRFDQVERRIDDTRDGLGARLRSVEEGQAEIKDLLIRALER